MNDEQLLESFKNSLAQLNSLEADNPVYELSDAVLEWKEELAKNLSEVNRVRIITLDFVIDENENTSVDIPIEFAIYLNPTSKLVATTILEDMIFKYSCNKKKKENIEKLKLLKAREENIDFELQLAEKVCGDHPSNFPYRTSWYLTQFFQNLGYSFSHDGSTRRYWVKERLDELNIEKIHQLIAKGLFKRKYFVDLLKKIIQILT